jgi:hypothetical protein
VIELSPPKGVEPIGGCFYGGAEGEAGAMHENDREHRLDDDTEHRPEGSETHADQPAVIRLLANPRRVRRA